MKAMMKAIIMPAALLAGMPAVTANGDAHHGMMAGTWAAPGFMWLGWLIAVLVIILLILLIIWLAKQLQEENEKKRK